MVFQFKAGSRYGVSAQVVGERLSEIQAIQGSLTPGAVVDDAADAESPLHPLFEWDPEVAARHYREDQARALIRSVYVVHVNEAGEETAVLGYIHVNTPDDGPCYVTTARAVSDDELRAQIEQEAIAAFQALRKRYEHIISLKGVFEAIDRAAQKRARRPRAKAEARA